MASRRKMESIGDYCYDKKEILGHGAFAIVFKGYKKQSQSVPVAVKCIAKKELSKSKELLAKEIRVLRELSVYQHENVVALLDVKETDSSVFLMIEFCNGGDLADYLQSKGTLSEDTLSSFMQQIASALNALNEKGIMHRDMKPQNILLCYPKGGSKLSTPPTQLQLKIADFGFARFLEDGKMAGTLCGSPMYMAPEVIMSHKYDSKADLWSVGTIIFQCLTGKAPFVASTPQQLRAFYEKNVDLKPKIPENTSPELKDMLLRLLTRDAIKRIGIKGLMHHPFLKKFRRTSVKRGSSSSPSPIPSRRRTPSMSSDSSTPGSTREMSPLARQVEMDPDKDMVSTITAVKDDESSFTGVDKADTRQVTDEGFVLVPKGIPEYKGTGEKEKKGKTMRAPLAEEEYDAVDESVHTSVRPVKLQAEKGKATFRKDEDQKAQQRQPSPTQPQPVTPRLSSPSFTPLSSTPPCQRSASTSAPIPVPSLSRTSSLSQQLQREGSFTRTGSPRSKKRAVSSGSADQYQPELDKPIERKNSDLVLAAPDITQVSPPAVQFAIGTPPNTGSWKRTSSLSSSPATAPTDPPVVSSPLAIPIPIASSLRRSASCSPGSCCPPHTGSSPSSLPSVPASPPKFCYPAIHQSPVVPAPDRCSVRNVQCYHRYSSSLESAPAPIATLRREESGLDPCHRCGTEPDLRSPFHSHHILRAAYAYHQHPAGTGLGALLPWGGSREHLPSHCGERDRGSSLSSLDQERTMSSSPRLNSGVMDNMSPQFTLKFTASPPKLDSFPMIPPELSEDTLMDDEHNQTMAKLSFILDVVECVVDLARCKGAACSFMAESAHKRWGDVLHPAHLPRFEESQKVLEQLVLYLRALQMMGQSISLAQHEMKEDRLQYVNSLKNVLHQQNELYLYCIEECRRLYQQLGLLCKTPLTPQMVINTADKLIYNYAVEQCQAAALDEVTGNTKGCFQRYTTAQVLLHSLAQLSRNEHDKMLLEKYRQNVELRLHNIGGGSSLQYPCDTCS